MIFQSVIRRAETAIENMVDQALARVMVALPLLVAAGFATAALSTYLNTRYGTQNGHLIMAGAFAAMGLVAMLYVSSMGSSSSVSDGEVDAANQENSSSDQASADATASAFTDAERELMTSVLTTAAPIAVPGLMRTVIRNLPLVILILIVGFILTRVTSSEANEEKAKMEASGVAEAA